jgi:hypothetical protein
VLLVPKSHCFGIVSPEKQPTNPRHLFHFPSHPIASRVLGGRRGDLGLNGCLRSQTQPALPCEEARSESEGQGSKKLAS